MLRLQSSFVMRGLPVAAAFLLLAIQPGGSSLAQTPKPAANKKTTTATTAQASDGETKFKENCSRCHNAPESISPSIAGTVVRHMRVKASLSKEDADAILHFLNP